VILRRTPGRFNRSASVQQTQAEIPARLHRMVGMFQPGTLYLDLRRMNRIIEINEKNMYAVVETLRDLSPAPG